MHYQLAAARLGTGLGRQESHTYCGPNNPDREIRHDLLGPAAARSGPGRSNEGDADQSGMERVEGGGYGEPNRAGPGRQRCGIMVKLHYSWSRPLVNLGYRTASRLPFISENRWE
jgi:hypothetical protein